MQSNRTKLRWLILLRYTIIAITFLPFIAAIGVTPGFLPVALSAVHTHNDTLNKTGILKERLSQPEIVT